MNRNGLLGTGLFVLIAILLAYVYFYNGYAQPGASSVNVVSTVYTVFTTVAPTSTVVATTSSTNPVSLPIVKIITPLNLSTVNRGPVNISANVIYGSQISQVRFYINGTFYSAVNSIPYTYVWNANNVTAPQYVITVRAYASNGAVGQANVLVDIGLIQHGK